MGYYLRFVFDPREKVLDRDTLLQKFRQVLARSSTYLLFEPDDPDYDGFLLEPRDHEKSSVSFVATIWSDQEGFQAGTWVSLRLSWGSEPEGVTKALRELLVLSDELGCRLFDPVIDDIVDEKNIHKIAAIFGRGSKWVKGAVGTGEVPSSEVKK